MTLWGVASGLALLTQYFAAFLVAAEALALLYRARSRYTAGAVGALTVIEIALIPHALPNLTRTAPWIVGVPLSLRIQQVPVAFGMNTLDLGPAVSYGLIGAAVLAAIVIALLVIGGEDRELRGAGVAAALAGAVLLTPILFALLHHDDYIARGLVPGWIPLAVLIGAACTAARARLAGAALAVVLLALFLYAGAQINAQARYQRPDWRGSPRRSAGRPGRARSSPTTGSSRPARCRSTFRASHGRGRGRDLSARLRSRSTSSMSSGACFSGWPGSPPGRG